MNLRIAIFHDNPHIIFPLCSAVFAFLAMDVVPPSVPIILTLTTLLVYGRLLFPAHAMGRTAILTLVVAIVGTVSRLPTALDALSTAGASVSLLFLSMFLTSFLTIGLIYIDTRICTRFHSTWSRITLFPALWATLWFAVSFTSPLGRLSAWSSTQTPGFYNWMAPYLGPVGNDWVVAAWAVVFAQVIGIWYIGEQEDTRSLLVHTTPATGQPSYISHSNTTLLLTILLASLALPSFVLNNLPLSVVPPATTPLSVGCVLPYKHHSLKLDDYIAESKRLTSSAKVLLWPEGAVTFNSQAERDEGLARVREVAAGSTIGVTFEEAFNDANREKWASRTGIAVVSNSSTEPQLLYYKQHLVPIAESFSLSHSTEPPKLMTLELSRPKGLNKTDWAEGPAFTRPIHITASICLDFAHASLFTGLESRPALILAPARTWDIAVGDAMWQQARERAEELRSMVLWCDGGDGGVSGIAGGGFRDFTQVGSGSWARTVGIQYPFDERHTPYVWAGDLAILLVWILVFAPSLRDHINFKNYRFTRLRDIFRRQNVSANGSGEGNLLDI